jgi:nitrate reductase NapE component
LDSVLVDNEQTFLQQISHIWPVIAFTFICTFIFIVFTRKFEVKSAE